MTEKTLGTVSNIYEAFVNAQKAFNPAIKNASNDFYKKNGKGSSYVDLAGCYQAVMTALHDNDIAVIQKTHDCENGVKVETVFLHKSGTDFSAGIFYMPLAKQDPHGYMGALTYARRGSLMAACGLAPEDDDGNSAMSDEQKEARKQEQSSQKKSMADKLPQRKAPEEVKKS